MEKQDILSNFIVQREPVKITTPQGEVVFFMRPIGFLAMQEFFSTKVPEGQNPVIAAIAELIETEAGERFTYDEMLSLDARISKPLMQHVRARLNLEDEGEGKN